MTNTTTTVRPFAMLFAAVVSAAIWGSTLTMPQAATAGGPAQFAAATHAVHTA